MAISFDQKKSHSDESSDTRSKTSEKDSLGSYKTIAADAVVILVHPILLIGVAVDIYKTREYDGARVKDNLREVRMGVFYDTALSISQLSL